jgi:hypothetical protein
MIEREYLICVFALSRRRTFTFDLFVAPYLYGR